jgi:type VI secretion system protein ImpF
MSGPSRVLPAILDRFTRPGETYTPPTLHRYTDGILRDLRCLLSARALLSPEDAEEFPEVAKSVVNYGVNDVAGERAAKVDVISLENELVEIIKCFEPRVKGHTLTIQQITAEEKDSPENAHRTVMAFEIQGEVWASPSPVSIRTELDLATGQHQAAEGGAAASPPRKAAPAT